MIERQVSCGECRPQGDKDAIRAALVGRHHLDQVPASLQVLSVGAMLATGGRDVETGSTAADYCVGEGVGAPT